MKKVLFKTLVVSAALVTCMSSVMAHNIQVGGKVPSVSVDKKGEIVYANDDFSYKGWQSSALAGKVRVVQAMAGRSSSKEINAPLMKAISEAKLPPSVYQTTTIVNTDDVIFGTAGFVRSSIQKSKKSFPHAQFVVDANGVVAKTWQLQAKGNAIFLLDKQGTVLFAKDGALTSAEVQAVVQKLKELTQ